MSVRTEMFREWGVPALRITAVQTAALQASDHYSTRSTRYAYRPATYCGTC
jgi:hypothetical protein